MRSRASVIGHPIHPALIPFPFAFLTGAFLFDAAAWLFGQDAWWTTGGHLAIAGIAFAILAAVPGLIDYIYTVPPQSSGKKRATQHMVLNLTAVALFVIAVLVRWDAAPGHLPTVGLELLATLALGRGGWLGGQLVNRNQIGVDHRYAGAGKWREVSVADEPGKTVTVGKAEDLQVDQMLLVRAGDRRIVVARTEGGFAGFDDRCTHRGGSLAGGTMACATVQCPWHGSQFDATSGQVKHGPAKQAINVYEVRVEAGAIKLRL